jgi:hypothetical protein
MSRFRRATALAICLTAVLTACTSTTALNFDDLPSDNLLGDTSENKPSIIDEADELAQLTSEEPTSESAVDASDSSEVESAFGALLAKWVECFHQPTRCDTTQFTAPKSPERTRLGEAVSFYSTEQIRTKPKEGRLEWSIESLTLPSNDRARLVVCEYDTRVFFDSSLADTALGDIIFDTTIWTRRVEWVLAKEDRSWQMWSRRIERRSPVARFCTP